MHEYEVLIETINPCGGEAHSKKEFLDIEAESPEAYVRAEGRWPVLDTGKNMDGDVVITTRRRKGKYDSLYVHGVKRENCTIGLQRNSMSAMQAGNFCGMDFMAQGFQIWKPVRSARRPEI